MLCIKHNILSIITIINIKMIKKISLAFCFIVKDGEKYLTKNLKRINQLKKYFQYIGMYSTQIYEAIENLVIDLIKFSKELDESILKVIFL